MSKCTYELYLNNISSNLLNPPRCQNFQMIRIETQISSPCTVLEPSQSNRNYVSKLVVLTTATSV